MKISHRFSTRLHAALKPFKRRLLELRAAGCLSQRLQLRVPIIQHRRPLAEAPSCVVIRTHEGRVEEIEADLAWLESRCGFSTCWRRLGAVLDLVAAAEVEAGVWTADLGDWVHLDGPVIGFCSHRPESLLVPDRGFHGTGGYRRERRRAFTAPAFDDRDPAIVWRGSPSGPGALVADPFSADNPSLVQRVRMCLLLARETTTVADARIVAGRGLPPDVWSTFSRAGIVGGSLPQASWCRRKFAIDIDGWSNAFSNFFIRLLYGCCVIKVASPAGYRQWYYDRLEPGLHFVPVAADLSDLGEKIAWCRAHPRECREIAAAGQQAAQAITPDSEREKSLEMLRAARASHDRLPITIPLESARLRDGRRLDRRAA